MTTKTKGGKGSDASRGFEEIKEQIEHVFLAGLGALSNAQKAGEKTFESLVEQGEAFRDRASERTESLIDEVQDAIRDMAGKADTRATGLIDKMRGATNLETLESAFDKRVASAMERLNVPSKSDLDKVNRKLNKVVRMLEEKDKPVVSTSKPKTRKKAAKKKVA